MPTTTTRKPRERQIDEHAIDIALIKARDIAEADKQRDPKPAPFVMYVECVPEALPEVDGTITRSYVVVRNGEPFGTLSRVEKKGEKPFFIAHSNSGKRWPLAKTSKSLEAMRKLAEGPSLKGRRDR